MEIKLTLYYDELAQYSEELKEIFGRSRRLEAERGYLFSKVDKRSLDKELERQAISKIRSIPPQEKGSIVTSGGNMLPLSNKKNLNLKNTPVLLVERDSTPAFVFPCQIQEKYYNIQDGLDHLEKSPDLQLIGEGEESLSKVIIDHPEILGGRLSLKEREFDTGGGKIDLLFQAENGKMALIETEREADDKSLGQILRLSAGYLKKEGLRRESIRSVIVCLRANPHVVEAAKLSGVEIFEIDRAGHSRKLA